MEKLFELTFQDQTLNPQIGTFTDASQTAGTFTLEDGEYYLTNGGTKGFYAYSPVAMQSGLVDDSKVIIEFDLKVVTASVNTHTIIGTYAGVDGSGIPTGAKITLQYNAGDIELVLGSGTTATLIESADVVVDQWYHFRIDCTLTAMLASTYQVKIDGVLITTVTGATTDYELGIISVLGTDLHACDECGIKNITLVTETNMYVGRTALAQVLQDVKGYVDTHCMDLTSTQTAGGDKTFAGTTTTYDVIPATTDTYDLGSSAKEYNNAYAKTVVTGGITLDNKAIDTDADDDMTFNGNKVDTIEEQGNGYIRYSNGTQICWGTIVAATQGILINFGKAFLDLVSYGIGVCPSSNTNCWAGSRTATGIVLFTEIGDGPQRRVDWIAIGTWK